MCSSDLFIVTGDIHCIGREIVDGVRKAPASFFIYRDTAEIQLARRNRDPDRVVGNSRILRLPGAQRMAGQKVQHGPSVTGRASICWKQETEARAFSWTFALSLQFAAK